jgi:geranylgeranyl pyrophosphate synthase
MILPPPINGLLDQHFSYEGEQIHLLTALYGLLAPDDNAYQHLQVAKCLEMMKLSTLITDDFLDRSPLRNGMPSLYAEFGAEEAVLIAEIIKSTATIELVEVLSRLGQLPEASRHAAFVLFEDAYRTVCVGQLQDMRMVREFLESGFSRSDESEYWSMIEKTTAAFIALPLLMGATLSGLEDSRQQQLRSYGITIGLLYQLRDDVLDLIASPDFSGKPLGGDIREKKIRLPIIHLLNSNDSVGKSKVKEIYSSETMSDEDVLTVIDILHRAGSIRYAMGHMSDLSHRASEEARQFLNPTISDALLDVTEMLLLQEEQLRN